MPGVARASPDWRWRSYICECPLGGRFDVSGQSCFATNSFWDSPLCLYSSISAGHSVGFGNFIPRQLRGYPRAIKTPTTGRLRPAGAVWPRTG